MHGMAWHWLELARQGMSSWQRHASHGMTIACRGIELNGKGHGMAWNGVAWRGMAWGGMPWQGMA